jgi:pantoate--beta-alanine ligase
MAARLPTVRKVRSLRAHVAEWRREGETVALVPTMGGLHEGHLSLVRLAKRRADRAVVSIFVNPTQFGPGEDFGSYPRDVAGDAKMLAPLGTDLIFSPAVEEMYPEGFATHVEISRITDVLCGASRPGHFSGVATVVSKLLLQCLPDYALFGEKDYQQLLVIKRMVADLNIPAKILGGPIVRDSDGLALSSRNAYLDADERRAAPLLYQTILEIAADLNRGRTVNDTITAGRVLLEAAGFRVDYLEVRDAATLETATNLHTTKARVFVAAFLGRTRLIDNVPLPKGA